jgi:hypothetical protein
MTTRSGLIIALGCFAAFALAPSAHAAIQRTFVSGSGSDLNPCTLAQPCRGFTAAIAQTVPGGEVIVLDSAGYGQVTINQAVSLIAPQGVYAGVSVFGGIGITIAAGLSDIVTLRNLTIVGLGGSVGIEATGVGQLRLEGLHVSGFTNGVRYGLLFTSPGSLTVTRSTFEGNYAGIALRPPISATAKAEIADSHLDNNTEGYLQGGGGTSLAHIVRTTASNNLDGFLIENVAGPTLVLEDCTAANNSASGIAALNGKLVISGNSITGNGTGLNVIGAISTESPGTNTVRQNATDLNGPVTSFGGT